MYLIHFFNVLVLLVSVDIQLLNNYHNYLFPSPPKSQNKQLLFKNYLLVKQFFDTFVNGNFLSELNDSFRYNYYNI